MLSLLFLLAATEAMISKFTELHVSKGHLLTVKGDAQKIKDTFFAGNPTHTVVNKKLIS